MDAIKSALNVYLRDTSSVASVAKVTPASQPATSTTSTTSATDSVQISAAAMEVAKYSSITKRLADHVSPSEMSALKTAVATGTYPAPLIVDGLLNLVGSSIVQSSDGGQTPQESGNSPD